MRVKHQTIKINRAQALAIADLLKTSPQTATYTLDQATRSEFNRERSFLYLHDRNLGDPCVMVTRQGHLLTMDSDKAF